VAQADKNSMETRVKALEPDPEYERSGSIMTGGLLLGICDSQHIEPELRNLG
jgi:hypothetical protein